MQTESIQSLSLKEWTLLTNKVWQECGCTLDHPVRVGAYGHAKLLSKRR